MPQSLTTPWALTPGVRMVTLVGVEHAVVVGDVLVLVAVPVFAGLEGPAAGAVGEKAVGRLFEEVGLAVERVGDVLGLIEAEEPALPRPARRRWRDGGHGLAEADGVLQRLAHQRGAGGLVHHGGGDVERGDERIERRGGAVHHERLVELVEVERRAGAELDVHHRAHGEGGEHLVRGLHGEDGRAVRHLVGNAHGEAAAIDGVELGVGVPGLVEVDARDGLGELLDDAVDVVAEAVVGGVGDDGVGGLLRARAGGEGAAVDELLDDLRAEALERNEADHAVAVARGLEVDGARAGDGERVADGFVAVGVGEDDVVLGDDAVADDLVGGARSRRGRRRSSRRRRCGRRCARISPGGPM